MPDVDSAKPKPKPILKKSTDSLQAFFSFNKGNNEKKGETNSKENSPKTAAAKRVKRSVPTRKSESQVQVALKSLILFNDKSVQEDAIKDNSASKNLHRDKICMGFGSSIQVERNNLEDDTISQNLPTNAADQIVNTPSYQDVRR